MLNRDTYRETYPVADAEVVEETVVVPDAPAPEEGAPEVLGEEWSAPAQPLVRVAWTAEPRYQAEKAPVLRRLGAALIDRLVPLPFLIPFFWPWALVVIAYDLLRDAKGASVGKRLLGLETVRVSSDPGLRGQPCTPGHSFLRNLLWAGGRLCYLSLLLSPVGFALDMTACLMAFLAPDGRHLGDRIGGTRVVENVRRERSF